MKEKVVLKPIVKATAEKPESFADRCAEMGRRYESFGKALQNSDSSFRDIVDLSSACGLVVSVCLIPKECGAP